MPPSVAVRIQDADVITRLTELGLTEEVLRDAIQVGWTHAAQCTSNDPASLPGTLLWGKATRHLRDTLRPRGWRVGRMSNYETTRHPEEICAVAVAAGNMSTGVAEETPSTRAPKGPATRDAVRRNQFDFTDVDPAFPAPAPPVKADIPTWLLLHYLDPAGGVIRLELSLPAAMSGGGVHRVLA